MPYRPILATLGYVISADTEKVLMIHRNKRAGELHFGKYNGLGGKMEVNEDIFSCMCREIQEEAGIECEKLRLRGTISWPGFGKNGEDWFAFIFLITQWSGQVKTDNSEGSLEWIPISQLGSLPLWDGDRHFLPLVFAADETIFHGVMPYAQGKPQSWNYRVQ